MKAIEVLQHDGVEITEVKSMLKGIRQLSTKPLIQARLCDVRDSLEQQVTRRRGYTLQALTVTRMTYPEHLDDPHAYRALVQETLRLFREMAKTGVLSGPSTGVIYAMHLQSNVHVHALYFGPPIANLTEAWLEKTGNSKQVHVESVYDPKGWIRYLYKKPTDTEDEAFCWAATRGLHLSGCLGFFTGSKHTTKT